MSLTHVVNTDPDNKYEPYTAANPMPVSVSGGGDSTAANQVLGNTSLSNIDSAIVTCDTGNMSGTVAVSAVAGSVAITSAGTLNTSDTTAQSSLSNIDSAVSGTLNVSDTLAQGSLTNIDSALTGTLLTKQQSVANKGSAFNGANNATLGSLGTTTAVDVSDMNHLSIFYSDTDTALTDKLTVMVSPDNSNYFELVEIYPSYLSGSTRTATLTDLGVHGITHIQFRNDSGSNSFNNVNITVVGSP